MELTHEFTVPAGVAETWSAFDDIESVAACFPGAQVTSVEGDTFQGSVKVKLGPIALLYNGTAGANVVATMTDEGGQTLVSVHTDLAITGKPAQFGRGVIQDVSDKLLGQFTACLEQKIGGGAAGPAAEPVAQTLAETPEAASATADTATGTAKAKQEAAPPGPLTAAPPPPPAQADDALDLGATVLPVLAKTYWREGLIAVLLLLLVLGRRRRG